MGRGDLSDAEWELIGPLLPSERGRWARPAGDNRRFLNDMLHVLRVGCPWRDMHERYGKWNSVYVRFRRWAEQGVWDALLQTLVDLGLADWAKVIDVVGRRQLVPFLDIAYQGFGENLEDDAVAVRLFAESGLPFLVASSFSKSFSLYGERVGALTMVTASKEETAPVLSQLKRVIRTNYSNPPTHGAEPFNTTFL